MFFKRKSKIAKNSTPPINLNIGGLTKHEPLVRQAKNEPLVRQAKDLPRKKRHIALGSSFVKLGVKADEKAVARLLELKPTQKQLKNKSTGRPQEAVEFDNLIVSEIERGVSPVELAFLLDYKSSVAITNRYKNIKTKYIFGLTQEGVSREK